MKILKLFVFIFIMSFHGVAHADAQISSFTTQVNKLWSQGLTGIKQVKKISDARLENDSQDIVGLVLRLEYAIVYSDFESIENTGDNLIAAIRKSHSERLIGQVAGIEKRTELAMKAKDFFPPEILEQARQRLDSGYETNGMLALLYTDILQLCEEEGLISAADLKTQYLSDYLWAFVLVIIVLVVMIYFRQRKRKNKKTSMSIHNHESV